MAPRGACRVIGGGARNLLRGDESHPDGAAGALRALPLVDVAVWRTPSAARNADACKVSDILSGRGGDNEGSG